MQDTILQKIVTALRDSAQPALPRAETGLGEALPPGLRIFAIGDIHGHADLLDRLIARIEADLVRAPAAEALAVFLGDYVDRGPDSCGVLDRLARRDVPMSFVTLRGNHEELMLDALRKPEAMPAWCINGGIETLQSYGLDPAGLVEAGGLVALHQAFAERLPAEHLAVVSSTALSYGVGPYFFVHAGARPGVPLDQQSAEDLMWIREECYRSDYDFGKILVHGHTPQRRPENLPRRINVDTGAFRWGVLTCAVLEENTRRFLSTRD